MTRPRLEARLGRSRPNHVPAFEEPSCSAACDKKNRDPFYHIGRSLEFRAVERRVNLGNQRRPRRSRKSRQSEGEHKVSACDGSFKEAEQEGASVEHGTERLYGPEEQPVYWKLLQKVLADLDLTVEQWRTLYAVH